MSDIVTIAVFAVCFSVLFFVWYMVINVIREFTIGTRCIFGIKKDRILFVMFNVVMVCLTILLIAVALEQTGVIE